MIREERVQETIDRIVKSFQFLILKSIFESITIEDVVLHSKVSRPTIYKYFESKQEILGVLAQRIIESWSNELVDHSEWKGSAKDKLSHLYRTLAKNIRFNRVSWSAMATSGAYYSAAVLKGKRHTDKFIAQIIADGQKKRQIKTDLSASVLASQLSSLQTAICTEWCLGYPRKESLSKRLKEGLDVFFSGVATE